MSMKTISLSKLRLLVREALDGKEGAIVYTPAPEVVQLSAVVDPSEDSSVPCNPNFKPHDKVEFSVAVNNLIRNLGDDKMPDLYQAMEDAVQSANEEAEDEEEARMRVEAKVERVLRQAVRQVLRKEGFESEEGVGIDYFAEEPPPPPKDRRKMSTMQDVGGATFEEIAKETGLSVAGAKAAVDKAMRVAQFLAQDLDYDERELIVLTAIRDYIQKLQKSGELTSADLRIMQDHPDIMRELDGFRDFLRNYIRRAERAHKKEM